MPKFGNPSGKTRGRKDASPSRGDRNVTPVYQRLTRLPASKRQADEEAKEAKQDGVNAFVLKTEYGYVAYAERPPTPKTGPRFPLKARGNTYYAFLNKGDALKASANGKVRRYYPGSATKAYASAHKAPSGERYLWVPDGGYRQGYYTAGDAVQRAVIEERGY